MEKFTMRFFVMVLLPLLSVPLLAKDIVVSPGDSLEKARDQAQAGDRILLKGGMYYRTESLLIEPKHSGVTWMAVPGEKPIICGGIPVTGWQQHEGSIYKARLERSEKLRSLYVNGQRAAMTSRPFGDAKGKRIPGRPQRSAAWAGTARIRFRRAKRLGLGRAGRNLMA